MEKKSSLLILDDEPAICSLIHSLIQWDELQLEFCGEAYDGETAFREICQKKPDIVITDIQMPGIDGLELIRRVRANHITCAFVIISGYSKFEYAKQAIEYKVENYLLKPIKKKELNQILLRIQERLARKQADEREAREWKRCQENGIQERWKRDVTNYLDNRIPFFTDFLHSIYGRDAFQAGQNRWIAALWREKHCLEEVKFYECQMLTNMMGKQKFTGYCFPWEGGGVFLSRSQGNLTVAQGYAAFRKLEGQIEKKEICFIMSEPLDTSESLQGFFASAWEKSWGKPLQGKETSVLSRQENKSVVYEWGERQRQELKNFVDTLHTDGISNWVFQTVGSAGWEGKKCCVWELIWEIIRTARQEINESWKKRIGEWDSQQFFSSWEFGEQLAAAESREEVIRITERELIRMMKYVRGQRAQREKKSVREAKDFIQAQYAAGISLEEVAQHVQLAPTYFSQLFKQETGKTYNEFLTDVRLEAAKTLLEDSDFGIAQVAEQVGYTDSRYFSKLFQKKVGIRPKEYRKLYS